tara:strand:+ start:331 stop:1236 length:906 start_codon:yes stop_codon:yes gene_type:complete
MRKPDKSSSKAKINKLKKKKTYKRKKKKTYKKNKIDRKRKSIKKNLRKQKGGNLEIILPAVGVVLAIGGVYVSNKMSNKNDNENKNGSERLLNQNGEKNTTNEIDPLKLKAESGWINNHLIVNIMLGKIQTMNDNKEDISIEIILLEPEQTLLKKYNSLLDFATEKMRLVSGYVNLYIPDFFCAYFLYNLSENPDLAFLDVFTEDFEKKISDQLKSINIMKMPVPDNIETIFNEAKTQINMMNSMIEKDSKEKNVKEFIEIVEKEYIKKYAPLHMEKIYNDNQELPDLESPINFYSKIIKR